MYTDEELVLKCKSGDEASVEILFNKYKPLLSKISRGYFLLGSDEDDLMQEAMIGLYKAIISFDPSQNISFKTFAFFCIKRNIISAIKSSNAKKYKILNESILLSQLNQNEEGDYLYLPSNVINTDEKIIENESFEEVKLQIYKALSKMELKILNLYLKGFSYQLIAEKLEINKKSVDNALVRIKNKLQFLII